MALFEKMKEAIELLKKEEFYLVKISVQYGNHTIFRRLFIQRQ